MKFRVLLVLATFLLAGPAFAQKIYIDYDTGYDDSQIKTFAWSDTDKTSLKETDPLLHSRIVNKIEEYIMETGVQRVEADPDVYVTYHGSSKEEISLNTTDWGYGYPSGWGYGGYGGYGGYYGAHYGGVYGGYGTSTTTVNRYQVGTLVVDIWDAETENLIWRGTAANITVSDNPNKLNKKIDTALAKMVKKWRKMKAQAKK